MDASGLTPEQFQVLADASGVLVLPEDLLETVYRFNALLWALAPLNQLDFSTDLPMEAMLAPPLPEPLA